MYACPHRGSAIRSFLLALVAGLIAFVVQSGELGTADTQHRLNSTHAFWTSEPPVYDWEYPEFGVHGRGGRLQSWYGIGQSLLMLPQDMIGTVLENLPLFAHYKNTDPTVRNIFVSYTTNILVTVSHGAGLLPPPAPIRVHRQSLHRRHARVVDRYHPPALHAEHDGEQLHLSAHCDRFLL